VPASSAAKIRVIVQELLQASPYLKAAAVVRVSGLAVETIMPPYVDEERVSAMASVMLLLGERITDAMQTGALDKVYISSSAGRIVLMAIDQKAVLIVMAATEAPVGLIFLEMGQAVKKLRKLV
jgi:predicted regulator of Ras-like GTPase activity (Roadblock/LC7/MglB family)